MWDDVYGFRMTNLKKRCLHKVYVDTAENNTVVSMDQVVHSLDLMTCTEVEASSGFTSALNLHILKDCEVTALVGYFQCDFTMGSTVSDMLCTSPLSPQTHWEQCVFFIRKPIPAKTGKRLL